MSAVRKTRRKVLSEFRCEEILAAASRVFAKKGFEGASVDEIAEAAKLAKGTVYVYFRSKRALYAAALRRAAEELTGEIERDTGAASAIPAKIRALFAARLRFAEQHPDFAALYHAEFGRIYEPCCAKKFKELYSQQIHTIEAVLGEGPAGAAAFLIDQISDALITRRLLGWSRATADEDIDYLSQLLWKGLAASSEPAGRVPICIEPGQC